MAIAQLTAREVEVLALIARGLTDKEIASMLGISFHTVHKHVQQAIEGLCARNRAEAVHQAHLRGYI